MTSRYRNYIFFYYKSNKNHEKQNKQKIELIEHIFKTHNFCEKT